MAKFKVGDKVKYHGRRAVVTEVHHDGESDYLLDVEGAGSGWYADEDEVTAANAARNAKFKVGDRVKVKNPPHHTSDEVGVIKEISGTGRPGDPVMAEVHYGEGATWGNYGVIYASPSIMRLANSRTPRSSNAVVRNALAAVCNGDPKAYDHSGHLVKVGDELDTRKGLAKIVRIKSRQDKPGLASWVGVTYKPDGTSVDEWLMTGVHGTLGSGIEAANARTARNADADADKDKIFKREIDRISARITSELKNQAEHYAFWINRNCGNDVDYLFENIEKHKDELSPSIIAEANKLRKRVDDAIAASKRLPR